MKKSKSPFKAENICARFLDMYSFYSYLFHMGLEKLAWKVLIVHVVQLKNKYF